MQWYIYLNSHRKIDFYLILSFGSHVPRTLEQHLSSRHDCGSMFGLDFRYSIERSIACGCALRTTVGWQHHVEILCCQHPYWRTEIGI